MDPAQAGILVPPLATYVQCKNHLMAIDGFLRKCCEAEQENLDVMLRGIEKTLETIKAIGTKMVGAVHQEIDLENSLTSLRDQFRAVCRRIAQTRANRDELKPQIEKDSKTLRRLLEETSGYEETSLAIKKETVRLMASAQSLSVKTRQMTEEKVAWQLLVVQLEKKVKAQEEATAKAKKTKAELETLSLSLTREKDEAEAKTEGLRATTTRLRASLAEAKAGHNRAQKVYDDLVKEELETLDKTETLHLSVKCLKSMQRRVDHSWRKEENLLKDRQKALTRSQRRLSVAQETKAEVEAALASTEEQLDRKKLGEHQWAWTATPLVSTSSLIPSNLPPLKLPQPFSRKYSARVGPSRACVFSSGPLDSPASTLSLGSAGSHLVPPGLVE
jgi:chromosome segregation ATPase